jgi:hypothetical protein
MHGVQFPRVLPGGAAHVSPGQQSASTVHVLHPCTHAASKQTSGGIAPGIGFGTHGKPLQQLALEAQAPPGATHCNPAQRGTPSRSGLQVSWVSHDPLQQSQETLHDIVGSLQASPSGLQPMGFRQTPKTPGDTK